MLVAGSPAFVALRHGKRAVVCGVAHRCPPYDTIAYGVLHGIEFYIFHPEAAALSYYEIAFAFVGGGLNVFYVP